MTRKEIIDGLQFTIDMFLFDPMSGETLTVPKSDMDKITIDACKGAIELLKQESCEDCISRQEVFDLINADWKYEGLEEPINIMPSVTPQPKIGRWYSTAIQGEIDGQIVKSFVCSECSAISVFRMAGGETVNSDLCPNCGAKMQGVEENDD